MDFYTCLLDETVKSGGDCSVDNLAPSISTPAQQEFFSKNLFRLVPPRHDSVNVLFAEESLKE